MTGWRRDNLKIDKQDHLRNAFSKNKASDAKCNDN